MQYTRDGLQLFSNLQIQLPSYFSTVYCLNYSLLSPPQENRGIGSLKYRYKKDLSFISNELPEIQALSDSGRYALLPLVQDHLVSRSFPESTQELHSIHHASAILDILLHAMRSTHQEVCHDEKASSPKAFDFCCKIFLYESCL